MRQKSFFTFVFTVLVLMLMAHSAVALAGDSGAIPAEKIVIMLGHSSAETSVYHVSCLKFAEIMAERSNGVFQVDVYPNNQLGGDQVTFESLPSNAVQMLMAGADLITTYVPAAAVFSLPFIFPDTETAFKALDSEAGLEILNRIEEHGIRYHGCTNAGFRQLQTVDIVVNSLADVKGLKVRVPELESYMRAWDALGAAPTPVPMAESFMALQTGVVDAQELPLDVFATSPVPEVCKNVAMINYRIQVPSLYSSLVFYKSLTPDQQTLLDDCAKEACEYGRKWLAENEAKYRGELEKNWGVAFTEPNLDEFREAVQTVYDNFQYPEELATIQAVINN